LENAPLEVSFDSPKLRIRREFDIVTAGNDWPGASVQITSAMGPPRLGEFLVLDKPGEK